MKLLQFGDLSIKLLYPIFVSLSRNLRRLCQTLLDVSSSMKSYPFFSAMFTPISLILGGMLEIILCLNQKTKKEKELTTLHGFVPIQKTITPDQWSIYIFYKRFGSN